MNNTILILLSLIIISGCYSKEPEKTTHKGESLPEFTLFLVDSSTYYNTGSLPKGKPVVLFYFGPRCPYSHAQMQEIIDDIKQFKDIQFVVFTTAPFNQMKWFYKKHKLIEYPNIKVGVDYTNFFVQYFNTHSVPYLAIYGEDKRLRDAFSGKMPVSQIENVADH